MHQFPPRAADTRRNRERFHRGWTQKRLDAETDAIQSTRRLKRKGRPGLDTPVAPPSRPALRINVEPNETWSKSGGKTLRKINSSSAHTCLASSGAQPSCCNLSPAIFPWSLSGKGLPLQTCSVQRCRSRASYLIIRNASRHDTHEHPGQLYLSCICQVCVAETHHVDEIRSISVLDGARPKEPLIVTVPPFAWLCVCTPSWIARDEGGPESLSSQLGN
jgi:hypothetical protein